MHTLDTPGPERASGPCAQDRLGPPCDTALRGRLCAASGAALDLGLQGGRARRFATGAMGAPWAGSAPLVALHGDADPLAQPFRDLSAQLDRANAVARRESRRNRALQRANDALEASNSELKSFAYAVSHDLKSPVQTVAMLLSELTECPGPALSAEQDRIMGMCRQTLARMSDLVEELLKYTRLIGTPIERRPCDLGPVVDSVIADLRADIAAAGATVRRGPLPVVSGDAVMLRILFQNLVSNAIKFRHPDRAPVIDLAGAPDRAAPGEAVVTVTDNGMGIAEEHRERIFDLFGRLHHHDDIPGSGLGLTMCRRIAQGLNGSLVPEGNPRGGSVFVLRLGGMDDD